MYVLRKARESIFVSGFVTWLLLDVDVNSGRGRRGVGTVWDGV